MVWSRDSRRCLLQIVCTVGAVRAGLSFFIPGGESSIRNNPIHPSHCKALLQMHVCLLSFQARGAQDAFGRSRSVGRYLGGAAHYNVHVCERCVRAVMGGGWRRRHEGRQRRLRLIGAAQRTTDRDRPLQRFSWPSLGSQGRRGRGKCSSVEAT